MKKPVRKRKGFDEGGPVRMRALGPPDPPEQFDVDKAADAYRKTREPWMTRVDRYITSDPRDANVASGTAATTRDKMKELPGAPPPRTELGLARGGKVKKVVPIKRKRR